MSDEYDFLFKSIVVGDGGVGKTALTLRFSKDFFSEDYKMTIGVDFHVKTLNIDTNEGPIRAKLQIWDTGGQERFSSIRPMYYRGSLGALLIFDLTNYESFEHLPQWIEEVRANVKSDIPLLLVGNKSDLINERTVSKEEINDFTGKFNLYYMETSAKTGEGVGDCFYILACLMIGSGVPDQFLDTGAAYRPGQFIAGGVAPAAVSTPTAPEVAASIEPEPSLDFEYAAPPVPEKAAVPKPEPIIEPEPEFEFAAPPVPKKATSPTPAPSFAVEPEPEIEFEAPSIPETKPAPAPVPTGFDFKMPEEILSEKPAEEKLETEAPTFIPKAVPFSSNVPEPAPVPEGFFTPKEISTPEAKPEAASPIFTAKPEPKAESNAMPFSVPFDTSTETEPAKAESSTPSFAAESRSTLPFSAPSPKVEASESLVDYMPETILSKKERKKLEKKRKKEEKKKKKMEKKQKEEEAKEKFRLEKEKEAAEKAKKKEKKETAVKEEPEPVSPAPAKEVPSTLFQSLSQKAEPAESKSSPFVPFMASGKSEAEEKSSLRIIPNVEDIDSGTFTPSPEPPKGKKKREIRICQQCGAMLSSDYSFCNKCGAKL